MFATEARVFTTRSQQARDSHMTATWLGLSHIPPLQMMGAIYTTIIKTIHVWHKCLQRSDQIADVSLSKFNDRLKASRKFRVFELGNYIYQVQIPDTSTKYITNLRTMHCDCTHFFDYFSPCRMQLQLAGMKWRALIYISQSSTVQSIIKRHTVSALPRSI